MTSVSSAILEQERKCLLVLRLLGIKELFFIWLLRVYLPKSKLLPLLNHPSTYLGAGILMTRIPRYSYSAEFWAMEILYRLCLYHIPCWLLYHGVIDVPTKVVMTAAKVGRGQKRDSLVYLSMLHRPSCFNKLFMLHFLREPLAWNFFAADLVFSSYAPPFPAKTTVKNLILFHQNINGK